MAKTTRRALASAVVLGLAVLPWLPAQGATPKTKRVSVRSNGDQADGFSDSASISANGRFIAYRSAATNLLGLDEDDNEVYDIFVYNRKTKKTRRVSVHSNGGQSNAASHSPAISANGRLIAFYSQASDLVDNDDNGALDVFVHNRKTKKTQRVSVQSDGGQADGHSLSPSISANGRFVAFESSAPDLVTNDNNDAVDVFVHDRETKKTKRISVRSNGDEAEGGKGAFISANGRFVAFFSQATDLVGTDANGNKEDIFVHDRETKKTKRVSVRSNGVQADMDSLHPSISGSGRFVAFYSYATNLVRNDGNEEADVFVHDRETKKTRRVSVGSNGDEGNDMSYGPSISANGRFVAFHSYATNLVTSDTDFIDVFVHDRATRKTRKVSRHSNGDPGEGGSSSPTISRKGGFVAFESTAPNLVAGDDNDVQDVFVRGPLR